MEHGVRWEGSAPAGPNDVVDWDDVTKTAGRGGTRPSHTLKDGTMTNETQHRGRRKRRPSLPVRKRPVHGVLRSALEPTIVFVTACTKDRVRWLATPGCHELLREIWREAAAWRVGRYVIMPDHVHLFASPADQDVSPFVSLEKWMAFWKSLFSKRKGDPGCRWQSSHWDRRLRRSESYAEKWEYVRDNPVRHGLVERAEDWPFQGELFELRW